MTHPVEVGVEGVLAGVLFTALRTDHAGVLVAEMNVLDVPLEGHLMKI
jgi:hypothetical protein